MEKSRPVSIASWLVLWVLAVPCVLAGQTPDPEPPQEAAPTPDSAPPEEQTEDVITVDSASPLADEQPPKDPWEILRSTPGVLTDRINIDGVGSCAAPASPFVEAGATIGQGFPRATETIFSGNLIERFFLHDPGFSLARKAPVRKDELASLELVADLRQRRGTNEWRASGFSLGGYGPEAANYIDGLRGISADVGGPLVVDRLWIWGGAGLHDLEQVVLGGQKEGREVAAGSLKLSSQIGENASVILATTRGASEGDNAGAAPDRAPETTWDETGGDAVWTAEATVIASADFYSTLSVGGVDRRLEQDPRVSGAAARIGADGVARGSWFGWDEELRRRHVRLDSTLFALTGPIHHEIVSGAGWRREDEERALTPPGPLAVAGSVFNLPGTRALAELWRAGEVRARTETLGLWAQDQLSTGGWTGLLGLHADRQDLGIDGGPRPWTLAPRLQLSRHVDRGGHWIVSFFLGRSASQLGPRAAWHVDGGEAVARPSLFSDLDGDLFLDPGEPIRSLPGNGFDPLRPGVDADAVDSRLRPEITDQALLGIETELIQSFQMGLQLIWRRTRNLLEERLLVRDLATGEVFAAASTDWTPAARLSGDLPDGTPYDVPVWDLRPGLLWTGGSLLANGDRRQEVLGLSLSWKKRFANRWMTDGHILWQDGARDLGSGFRRFDDPTNLLGGGDDEGEIVGEIASGRPHETPRFEAARWSFGASGLVMVGPGGEYQLLASVRGRQGHPLPYFRQVVRERAGTAYVQLTDRPDTFRTDDLLTVDAAVQKEFDLGDASFSLSLQALNLLNEDTVLERELDLGTGRAGFADETLSSRTLRVELRFWWR